MITGEGDKKRYCDFELSRPNRCWINNNLLGALQCCDCVPVMQPSNKLARLTHLHTAHPTRHARRPILHPLSPPTLRLAQHQFQYPPLSEKLMSDPIPRITLPIQCRALHVYVLLRLIRIEVDVSDSSSLISKRARYTDRWEERGRDEIHILPWVREEAEHAEDGEGCHGARVVVARKTGVGGVEARRNVCSKVALGIMHVDCIIGVLTIETYNHALSSPRGQVVQHNAACILLERLVRCLYLLSRYDGSSPVVSRTFPRRREVV